MQETRREVLDAIADGPISGPDLAARLDVSRAAVWKHVEALREAGFGIESDDSGYRLDGVPEYGGEAIEFDLGAPFEIEYHDSLPSTNARARELAAEGATDVAVVADEQTGGRGRLDRGWVSPPGGVWLSVLCRPDLPPAHAPILTLAAAVAAAEAAREAGVDARIKWPNDLLVPGADSDEKLAGILTEMEGEADRVSWVVVGIGINVREDGLPEGATGLLAHTDAVDRRIFVQRLLERFDTLRDDPKAVMPAWRDHALTLGQRVRVETTTDEIVGEAVDVEFPGSLVVETDDGRVRVHTGDCEHLRPA
ncbi:biotin--[acetyl-CoA-carboxylase] ligase [Halococcus saccharolyticus]|uniref:Biotin--acetyl-CoA-carboxylase ligase n=1 Tax=Halococcus saccharolyticus DSM 5350 TaxID=1227455 RepID=M0MN08_9EURY|nr:biotin--[acetyl-CoA-carboxylase] ligase [Halococcus saccharolyticus]EMA46124.1 biotin--acetyl-CoA-carboxylase ligase [Halococcus saccharolyticus DSM 5350]